ncbi:hypothetical protein, partial [Mesorhizobium captivum]|uniref:hypothetical protein n=1 Tax=Mesorhizobium captivum TaxID=3072319 RepID=UPI002A24F033
LSGSRSLRADLAGRRLLLGAVPVELAGASVELNVTRPFCLTFSAERISFELDGRPAGKVLRLQPMDSSAESLRAFMGTRRDLAGTQFSLQSLEAAGTDLVFDAAQDAAVTVRFESLQSIDGEAFRSKGRLCQIRLYDGPAKIEVNGGQGESRPELFFERAVCVAGDGDAKLVARTARHAHSVDKSEAKRS